MKFKDDLQKEIYYRSQIDYCYWRIQDISNLNEKIESPINLMIDNATGYNKVRVIERIDELIYLAKCIIKCKPKCIAKYDTVKDKEMLTNLQKLKHETKNNNRSKC